MLGRSHALCGAVVMLAACPALSASMPALAPCGLGEIACAGVVCAGAALLPDVDHPKSTVAYAFGPFTQCLARLVERVAGGHRHGTHSLLFAAVCAAVFGVAGFAGGWWAWVPIIVLIGLAASVAGVMSASAAVAVSGVVIGFGGVEAVGTAWLGAAVGLGVVAHLMGDCLTVQGCPLLWPNRRRFGLDCVRTGSSVERRVVIPCLGGVVALLAVWISSRTGDVVSLT